MFVLIRPVVDYNDNGFLIYADNYCGAYTLGRAKEEALKKFDKEIRHHVLWTTGKSLLRVIN